MKDYFLKYAIVLGKRYTKRQKAVFVSEFVKDIGEMGYKSALQTGGNALLKANNVVIGNVDNAKVIIVAGYDTGSKAFIPGFRYYPFNTAKNLSAEKVNLIISFLLAACFILVGFLLFKGFAVLNGILKYLLAVAGAVPIIAAIVVVNGISNSVNYNRNSAAVVLIRDLLDKLCETPHKDDVAIILADRTISSYDGYRFAASMISKADNNTAGQSTLVLDSLADGETLVVAYNDEFKPISDNMLRFKGGLDIYEKSYTKAKSEANITGIFPNSIYLACGFIADKEFVVYNTRAKKDYKADILRLEKIEAMLFDFICKSGEN